MFLKSIEVRGFKSFADKTNLAFKKGVTAVVGPNGSGKSNISDAVRWVLGEQSVKTLRGGKMEDVIFAGTQFRKPVSLAQVSLTLDNSDNELPIDYSDVTISRRLYRSGDSEYYINNTLCRLKDIHELFMDTGIGKEGYSIIGQGKIDAILSGRPEERRSLLEEAAGIVKFKTRKEEAEKKLENTDQYLLRINDILSTYEERLQPLELECEKAKEFLNLSNDLKQKEVNIIVHSLEIVQDKIKALQEELLKVQSSAERLEGEKLVLKQNLQEHSQRLEAHENKISEQKQTFYENKANHQNLVAENNILKERVDNLSIFMQKSLDEISEVVNKLDNLSESKLLNEDELESHQKNQNNLNREIQDHERSILNFNSSLSQDEELLKRLKEDEVEYLSEVSTIKNNSIIINNDIETEEKKLDQIKLSCEGYVNSIKINSNTKQMLDLEITRIKADIVSLEDNIKNNKTEMADLINKLSLAEKELKQLNTNHNKAEANYHMLLQLEKQYEGYNKSVKNLMRDITAGKIKEAQDKSFVLGDVIQVKREFETAIEIALGGSISDIITADDVIAKKLINYLKQNNLGRATFLPLSIIRSKRITETNMISSIDGYIGVACDLIGFDGKFASAIQYVLGRTIISRDMDSALEIAKKTSFSYRIVTLSGETVNPGGSLTGGSVFHKSSNIIGRKREIDELQKELNTLSSKIKEFSLAIADNKANIKNLDDLSLNFKDEIYKKNIEITRLQGDVANLGNENSKIAQSLTISKNEIDNITKRIEENSKILKDNKFKIETLKKKEEENQVQIFDLENKLAQSKDKMQSIRDTLMELKIKKAQVDETVVNKIRDLERLSKELDEYLNKKVSLENEVNKSKLNSETLINEIANNDNHIDKASKYISDFEEIFKESELTRIKIKDSIKIYTANLEQVADDLNRKEEEKHKLELNLTRFESEKESLYLKLNDELELTLAEALDYKQPIFNMEDYKKNIAMLKNKISSLGVVNVGAIEEYSDLREKYTFMNTQRSDLISAKEELLTVIEDMTEKMKLVFNENFNKLKVLFNETFTELFKGGSADLILSDNDELTSNIEINVQPPGKKLQNINLMSGGEKVLSAIALLFAILKMKPTPFCILDEIEAALDDANVFRYAEFLKKFSSNIQFIVITHRKGTMEASDVLYGVTMEEKGISKIVSVDLNK